MAPIKFEENIKETIEKRTIQPSQEAWGKLEARLDENSGNNSTKWFWVLGVAASLVGILLVSTFFFKNNIQPVENNTVVDIKKEDNSRDVNENANNQEMAPIEIPKEEVLEKPSTQIASENKIQPKPSPATEIEQQPNTGLAMGIQEKKSSEEPLSNYEDLKVNEVVAQVQELVKNNQTVTEGEIDSLLKLAQQDIKKHKIYNETTGAVDAMALLQDVEGDLDKSFRDKVFEALVNSVEDVATAVAQRNN